MPIDRDPAKKAFQWQFLSQNSHWTWRKLLVDGALDAVSNGGFPDYAFAVNDAINHGFRPRRDYWVILTENGTTHFHAGEPPVFVPRGDGDQFPPLTKVEARPSAAQSLRTHRKSVSEQ